MLLGVYKKDPGWSVVKPEQSGLMFIAWRCLYAAIVGSRVDNRPLNLEYAYYRTLQMTITRVRAYGEKWRLWCVRNKYTSLKCIIPVDKRDRTVIDQDMLGDYSIAPDLLSEFQKVCAARVQAPPAQRPQVPHTRSPQRPRPRPEQRTAVQHEPVAPLGRTTQLTLQQAFGQAPST